MTHRRSGIVLTLALVLGSLAAPAARPEVAHAANTEESFICIEASTGLVIAERNADIVRPPASMVKMMLMLMVAEGLEQGLWTPDRILTVSPEAESINEAQVFLRTGEQFTLDHLMSAVAVCSANDAAFAVAENLWGSEAAYLEAMNARAQELGMFDSRFYSVHGLPPGPGGFVDETTARDMAILAQHCAANPTVMHWAGQTEIRFRPHEGLKRNTNKLLWQMAGCDGLKTGYTRAAGWCLAATAQRDGIRLIAVVMGCPNNSARFASTRDLLERCYGGVSRELVVAKGQPMPQAVHVANCSTRSVQLTAADDVWAVVPADAVGQLELVTAQPEVVQAPLNAGTVLGEVQVRLNGRMLCSAPLAVPQTLEPAGWKWKLENSVKRNGSWLRRAKQGG